MCSCILPGECLWRPYFLSDIDAARQDISSCKGETVPEKMRVCPETDKTVNAQGQLSNLLSLLSRIYEETIWHE